MISKIIIALYILTTSAGLVILKLGSTKGSQLGLTHGKFNVHISPYTAVGVGLYGLSFFLYMYLISKYELGYIIPLLAAFVYVLIFVASYFVFHESFTVTKILGISFILIGLLFLNINK